ncbi:YbaB/EbfC family nucleoid-associated protein [Saccharothrix coeruleofusca]|uniref:YbaB/EbfC DNA-binding family protein n=1 Tax=Saccharothrix coeruleofusca TaxID=33919 RepID=A0A918ECT3_9PSEU|nr:YbaB/EbfC family nucleoid-associated protein [Saccharothrix coeruleofusca]MBP2336517.1 hypothetical protein [Saccharothrix coeruleofusca]GGP52457.1 hypothetical protein GCM10010185_25710 [Saccharothrix coeruleofusca]
MSRVEEDALERRIEEWSARAAEKVERYQALQRRLSGLAITERGLNGGVEVTVGQSGLVTAMHASDALQVRPSQLVEELMSCMRRAQARLADQVEAVMREEVGDDPESVAAVSESFHRAFPRPEDSEVDDDEQDEEDGEEGYDPMR